MATAYTVLRDTGDRWGDEELYIVQRTPIEASNAEQACRTVANDMDDKELADGVTLIAIPARNWTSGRNTFKAETRRRLLRS